MTAQQLFELEADAASLRGLVDSDIARNTTPAAYKAFILQRGSAILAVLDELIRQQTR